MQKYKIAFLGGDKRELIIMKRLLRYHYDIWAYAIPPSLLPPEITFAESIKEALTGASAGILPVGGVGNGGYLANLLDDPVYIEKSDLAELQPGAIVLCGVTGSVLPKLIADLPLHAIAVMEYPQVAESLALATAEGALAVAIGAGEGVLWGAECLIVGYGRIGRELAPRLAALGAHVRIANRGNDRLEAAKTAGFAVIEWGDWIQTAATSNYIFNTAPALLFDSSVLQKLNPQTVLIDLASAPGGVDWQTADLLGIQAVRALGLPGKYAPGFAGLVLADVYEQILWDCLAKRGNRDERS